MSCVQVMKFGGSTFSDPANIGYVAKYLKTIVGEGNKVVVVISAPTGLTETFRSYIKDTTGRTVSPVVDELINLSDRVGALVLYESLLQAGLKAKVGTGIDTGILTDDFTGGANVIGLDDTRLRAMLAKDDVLVLPGGQGHANGKITWLGKNSSDYSAVLIAECLQANELRIHSDVSHVFNKDPNRYSNAQPFLTIGADQLIQAAQVGAKVLHPKAVQRAKKAAIKIITALNKPPFNDGTQILDVSSDQEFLVHDRNSIRLEFAESERYEHALPVLKKAGFAPIPDLSNGSAETWACLVPACYLNPLEYLNEELHPATFERWECEHIIKNDAISTRYVSRKEVADAFIS